MDWTVIQAWFSELLGINPDPLWWLGVKWTLRMVAGLSMFTGHTRYGWAVIRTDYDLHPDARPHRGTWFTWASVDMTIYLYMLFAGTATAMTAVDAFINLGIFVISLFVGIPKWKKSEKEMILIAGLGVLLFLVFSLSGIVLDLHYFSLDGLDIGLLFACCATTYGVVPTWKKERRKDPASEGEDPFAWGFWTVSCAFGVLGLPQFDVKNAAQPLAFIVVCGSMSFLIFLLNPFFPYQQTPEDKKLEAEEDAYQDQEPLVFLWMYAAIDWLKSWFVTMEKPEFAQETKQGTKFPDQTVS